MKHKISVGKCGFAVLGVLLIGTGVAFNAMAQLGNDPVGIFYDGVRSVLGLPQSRLGLASNAVNICFLEHGFIRRCLQEYIFIREFWAVQRDAS